MNELKSAIGSIFYYHYIVWDMGPSQTSIEILEHTMTFDPKEKRKEIFSLD